MILYEKRYWDLSGLLKRQKSSSGNQESSGLSPGSIATAVGTALVAYAAYRMFGGGSGDSSTEDPAVSSENGESPGTTEIESSKTESKEPDESLAKTDTAVPVAPKLSNLPEPPKTKEFKAPEAQRGILSGALSKITSVLSGTDSNPVPPDTIPPVPAAVPQAQAPSPRLPAGAPSRPVSGSIPEPAKKTSVAKTTKQANLSQTPLEDGYRGKFQFQGFTNSDSLSKNGSYTQAEAQEIIRLKSTKSPTGATGGLAPDLKDFLVSRSIAYGLNPDDMIRVVAMESGGNPNAISSTGAIGLFQFTGSTGSALGLKNRFDPYDNIEAGLLLATKNKKLLEKADVKVNETSLYLVHQLGPTAAKEVLRASDKRPSTKISDLKSSTQNAVRLNAGGGTAVTAKDYVDLTSQYLATKVATSGIGLSGVKVSENAPSPVSTSSIRVSQAPDLPKDTSASTPALQGKPVQVALAAAPNHSMVTKQMDPTPADPSQSLAAGSPTKPQGVFRGPSGVLLVTS